MPFMQSMGNTTRFQTVFFSFVQCLSNVRLAASLASSTLQRAPPSTGPLVSPTSHTCTGASHLISLCTCVCGSTTFLHNMFMILGENISNSKDTSSVDVFSKTTKNLMICIFSIELRDTGLYGFILPPDQIIPTAEESWAFHKVRI